MTASLRTLDRGLNVLGYLNKARFAAPQHIAKALALPLPTVYRIIETLAHGGFVERVSPDENVYRLTIAVRRLSGGMTCESVFVSVATPVLFGRREQLKWPSAVSTFEADSMVVRESTDRFSPQPIGLRAVGRWIPMLSTPLGWAYLAFSPDEQRREIVAHLRRSPAPENRVARDPHHITHMVRTVQADGYCASDEISYKRCGSIALPVLSRGRVFGCISTAWPSSLIAEDAAIARLLPVLREAKAEIEQQLESVAIDW
ncbi:helix-turn-helix domain-containing protein [Massilia sp. DWR3-1-1]|uniref:helix-turn-helix domain-containing protein n=1 Tax=Massilia sp. DWR3-1-1 TaxID=2804559 RepID=UPI003CF6A29F